jgi:DNA (cytosine-5)-methyltransferase 1
MIHIGLFEGLGGFGLAAKEMGWRTLVSCEIADFPSTVLKHHFPEAYHHDDVKTLTYDKIDYELTKRFGIRWRAEDIVLTGGFPCQPYSAAGKRLGKEDDRHLWPEMLRIIREVSPRWVVGENVLGIVNWNGGLVFNEVQVDLETEGYEVQPYVLPAASINAPHRRDRVWFVAHAVNG